MYIYSSRWHVSMVRQCSSLLLSASRRTVHCFRRADGLSYRKSPCNCLHSVGKRLRSLWRLDRYFYSKNNGYIPSNFASRFLFFPPQLHLQVGLSMVISTHHHHRGNSQLHQLTFPSFPSQLPAPATSVFGLLPPEVLKWWRVRRKWKRRLLCAKQKVWISQVIAVHLITMNFKLLPHLRP